MPLLVCFYARAARMLFLGIDMTGKLEESSIYIS